ncbi:hypothetical protein BC829DRAFT_29658 [Chytridium lagenaria]|nr:hypothetical protein BC829DRAFT_29658 [Chytridium lagenaria]
MRNDLSKNFADPFRPPKKSTRKIQGGKDVEQLQEELLAAKNRVNQLMEDKKIVTARLHSAEKHIVQWQKRYDEQVSQKVLFEGHRTRSLSTSFGEDKVVESLRGTVKALEMKVKDRDVELRHVKESVKYKKLKEYEDELRVYYVEAIKLKRLLEHRDVGAGVIDEEYQNLLHLDDVVLEYKKKLGMALKKISYLKDDLRETQDERDFFRKTLDDTQQELKEAKEDVSFFKQKNDDALQDIDRLVDDKKMMVEDYTAQIRDKNSDINDLELDLEKSRQDVISLEEEVENCEELCRRKEKKIDQLLDEKHQLNNEINHLNDEKHRLIEEKDQLNDENKQLYDEKRHLQTELNRELESKSEMMEELSDVVSELQAVKKELLAVSSYVEVLKKTNTDTKTKLDVAETRTRSLEVTVKKETECAKTVEGDLRKAKEELKKALEEARKFQEQASEREARCKSLEKTVMDREREEEELKKRLSQYEKEIEGMKVKTRQLSVPQEKTETVMSVTEKSTETDNGSSSISPSVLMEEILKPATSLILQPRRRRPNLSKPSSSDDIRGISELLRPRRYDEKIQGGRRSTPDISHRTFNKDVRKSAPEISKSYVDDHSSISHSYYEEVASFTDRSAFDGIGIILFNTNVL